MQRPPVVTKLRSPVVTKLVLQALPGPFEVQTHHSASKPSAHPGSLKSLDVLGEFCYIPPVEPVINRTPPYIYIYIYIYIKNDKLY